MGLQCCKTCVSLSVLTIQKCLEWQIVFVSIQQKLLKLKLNDCVNFITIHRFSIFESIEEVAQFLKHCNRIGSLLLQSDIDDNF